jgi:hypothetical protein
MGVNVKDKALKRAGCKNKKGLKNLKPVTYKVTNN